MSETKQDLVVADSTGSIRLIIWEEVIGSVEEDKLYRFEIPINVQD